MPLPNLPPEILSIIIDFAQLTREQGERDNATITRIALTSRLFLDMARRTLYRSLLITAMAPLDLRNLTTRAQRPAPSEYTKLLITSLAVNPHLATLVRSVALNFAGSLSPAPAELLTFLFKTCPNMIDLTMSWLFRDKQSAGLARSLAEGGNRLRRLCLKSVSVEDPAFMEAIFGLVNLDELGLAGVSLSRAAHLAKPALQLNSIHYRPLAPLKRPYYREPILKTSHDSLRHLQLEIASSETLDLSPFRQLRSLILAFSTENVSMRAAYSDADALQDARDAIHTLKTTTNLPHLETLTLRLSDPPDSPFYTKLAELDFLSHLPTSIETLHLPHTLSLDYILHECSVLRLRLPKLKNLELPPCVLDAAVDELHLMKELANGSGVGSEPRLQLSAEAERARLRQQLGRPSAFKVYRSWSR